MHSSELNVKIWADCADEHAIELLAQNPIVSGFTTNPTLLVGAGVKDYAAFAKRALTVAVDRPVSFEVLADTHEEMYRQARAIADWGSNAVVKIPITTTTGESTLPLVECLVQCGVTVNVTAVFTAAQAHHVRPADPAYISIFAGRVADTGLNPATFVRAVAVSVPSRIIWASTRELLNVVQADACGCYAITLAPSIIEKLPLLGKDLTAYSLETVQQFYRDAQRSGLVVV